MAHDRYTGRSMSKTFLTLVLLGSVCSSACAQAQDARFTGVWRLISYDREFVETKQRTAVFGEKPSGYISYSPGGRVVVALFGSRPVPGRQDAYDDADRVKLYGNIIAAYSGTYSVEGDRITHRIESAWVPTFAGADQARRFEFRGNRLIYTTDPRNSLLGGGASVNTLTLERIE